jgi:hypothetical protein
MPNSYMVWIRQLRLWQFNLASTSFFMATPAQRELIDEALRLEGGEFSDWARALLVRAAEKRIARALGRTKDAK